MKKGKIRISSENMMPIIKKWLYSDKDIFLREIVANGIDAITKFKKLATMGEATEAEGEGYCVKISVDPDQKTLCVEDNGIGMSEEEVEKYITQIAFLSKYEKAGGDGIIGHFGLGFYSAYMVSSLVEIETKSYKEDAPAVKWSSDGNSTYQIGECDRKERGTKIIMHIADEEKEFLNESNIKGLVRKYCSFMPYNIYVGYKGDGKDEPLNTTLPLYAKAPKDCTDEEYKKFYTDTFMDYNEPIFWVHLNMDYPFKLKGILYFPKVKNKVELERGKVKLYCNQVFIADNIKEVIPEFLMLLNGVIDCPDIPLNVSRSFLQNDRQVQRISKYITKKVADKLIGLFNDDRAKYEEYWSDLANFVKFGCIKDGEFYDKVKDIIIWKDIDGNYKNLKEFLGKTETDEATAENGVDGEKKDEKPTCDTFIDPHFISFVEYKVPDKVKFMRIDADVADALKGEDGAEDSALQEIFKKAIADDNVKVVTRKLKNSEVPAIINVEEYIRRYSEMGQFYGMTDGQIAKTLVINTANPVVARIKELPDDKQGFVAKYVYTLALLSFKKLSPEELNSYMADTLTLLGEYVK